MLTKNLQLLILSIHLFIIGAIIETDKKFLNCTVRQDKLCSKRTIKKALKLQDRINRFRKLEKRFMSLIKEF